LANGRVLRPRTENVCPPVPDRSMDWTAVDDSTYEPGCPIGWGPTEEHAIKDLVEQICDEEDTCAPDCECCKQEAALADAAARFGL
jgi:hypothetical protein